MLAGSVFLCALAACGGTVSNGSDGSQTTSTAPDPPPVLTPPAPTAPPPAPGNQLQSCAGIMPLGDSITLGVNGGYRNNLYTGLQQNNCGVSYVGTLSDVNTRVADKDHDGHPGLTIGDIPVDAVTTSASGIDPDISPANAKLQSKRVAAVRHLPLATVQKLISKETDGRSLGFFGEPGVNVLELNLALDRLGGA